MRALSYIGKEGLPALLETAANQDVAKSTAAASHICDMINLGTNARPAVPRVVAFLSGPDGSLAGMAAHVLGCWGIEPELVVPALAKSVEGPTKNTFLRFMAAESLGKFGREAGPAVPVLVEVLSDADGDLRLAATNALRRIAPEVLGINAASGENGK